MTNEFPRVDLQVNGEQVGFSAHPTTPLMYLLRNDLGCKGVRTGCSIGECGVCTIIMDGQAVRSCLTPLSEAADTEVLTPEGLGGPTDPHPVQQAFLTEQAAQCGYCVNGMIMTVAASLEADPQADAETLRTALDEHICRCGTQDRLIRAANRAAGRPCEATCTVVREPLTPHAPPASIEPPQSVLDRPEIERWITLDGEGVHVETGKVELGQGIRTAQAQLVAGQLGIPLERVHVATTATGRSPDQGQTSGSFSIEVGGRSLAIAASAFRRVLLVRAAELLASDVEAVKLDAEGAVGENGARATFAELAEAGPLTGRIEPTDLPRWDAWPLGESLQRPDLLAKLTGAAAYVHDLAFEGMLHARAFLPPTIDATVEELDLDPIRGMPGVREVLRDGRLVVVIAEREEQALRAHARLSGAAKWGNLPEPVSRDGVVVVRDLPSEEVVVRRDDDVADVLAAASDPHRATYTRGYQAHGPMAPSAAVAIEDDGILRIWTHSQGIYPLRRELAALFDRSEEEIVIEHADGPGCYGLNLADDAAAMAAIAAMAAPGLHVRLQFSMPDEFGWDPTGSAMIAELSGAVGDGRIQVWRHDVTTDSHSTRANGDGDRLLPAWLRADGVARPWVGLGEPGVRNSVPLYDIPAVEVVAHHYRGPLRTGPLRSLGSFVNTFACESFMDELAERAGVDPVEFRLAHLSDERARRVLELAAERAGWTSHVGPSGKGQGVALCRYKDSKAWAAIVADVEVDQAQGSFRVDRLVIVADAGAIVNPDGLRNQLEGGALQGLSRTLYEELHLGSEGPVERDWTTYPALRFGNLPRLEVTLVDRPDQPPIGSGESSTPAVPPAIANALDDAMGVRLRSLPLTPASLERRLLDMDEAEASRVLL